MKCFFCDNDARAVCRFCGRAVCGGHSKTKEFHSGYGQKGKDLLWPSGSETGVSIQDAVWCGKCFVQYQRTY
ncbi:MAG: hypothetical protein ACYC6Y_04315 [Thermoguttaceae bacterium]